MFGEDSTTWEDGALGLGAAAQGLAVCAFRGLGVDYPDLETVSLGYDRIMSIQSQYAELGKSPMSGRSVMYPVKS